MDILLIILIAIYSVLLLYIIFLLRRSKLDHQQIHSLGINFNKSQEELARSLNTTRQKDTIGALAGPIISGMDQGVICIDRNRIVQFVNPYAEKFLDSMPAVGKPYQEVLHGLQYGGRNDFSVIEASFAGKKQVIPDNFEMATGHGNIPISGTIMSMTTDGYDGMIVFIFADNSQNITRITEDKAFFSAASHELRTPLTVIRLASSLLLTKLDTISREKIIEHLTQIDRTSEYLVNLVNNFLNVSRIEQGRLQVEKESFDIVSLTNEVVSELTDMAKERKLYIHHEPASAECRTVVADRTKSKEVLTNLISNGIKYTLRGGLTITHHKNNANIDTKITDTGTGIQKESQHMLFIRYMQIGDARMKPSVKSTGLGLYISKKFAQLMHGDVYLESSEPGTGSTFTFRLPTR